MGISLHRSISNAQAAPEAKLPQEASTTLRNVFYHPALRDTRSNRERERAMWVGNRTVDQLRRQSTPKPTDPELILRLGNATQPTFIFTHVANTLLSTLSPSPSETQDSLLCQSGSWTSRSSASCCHLEPGRSTPERGTPETDREVGQTEVERGERHFL